VTSLRKLVFISHARPEDDELTRWESSRITRVEVAQLLREAWRFGSTKPKKTVRSSRRSKPDGRRSGAGQVSRRT
jgi:hypothetical protein